MSLLMSGEPKAQDLVDKVTENYARCRIPQRCPPGRNRAFNSSTVKPKGINNAVSVNPSRPMSGNKHKDKPVERAKYTTRKPLSKISTKIGDRVPCVTVPLVQKSQKSQEKSSYRLPDQETFRRYQENELRTNEFLDSSQIFGDTQSNKSKNSDNKLQMKINWQEKVTKYENMKKDLEERQNALVEIYQTICNTHNILTSLGEKADLPPAKELRIFTFGKNNATKVIKDDTQTDCDTPLPIKVEDLFNMPTKLVDTCEQTLAKRQEVIDWFQTLKTEKSIGMKVLTKKITEFNSENDMLRSSLDQVKTEFQKELENIVAVMKKGVNDTVALQLNIEELMYELSELNSKNADLRKQLQNSDNFRSISNKQRFEDLEKELKDEKCSKLFLKDRLSRAEGQAKMQMERASQLEASLAQTLTRNTSLEIIVQQLKEQNQNLQSDYDKELKKFNESIKEHTIHLEEIVESRKQLQADKEDLEKRLKELSESYAESLQNVKDEMRTTVAKIIETENKYEHEVEERKSMEVKVTELSKQAFEAESRYSDLTKELREKEARLQEVLDVQKDLESVKEELKKTRLDREDYNNRLLKLTETLEIAENKYKELMNNEKSLKHILATKDEYIKELKNKQELLESQQQENEQKMETCVEQLSALKKNIKEFENIKELNEMIKQQKEKLSEVAKQHEELTEMLQEKQNELDTCNANIIQYQDSLDKKDKTIKMLTNKDAEHTNIIQILRSNLELRSQADADFSEKLQNKVLEIESLASNLDTKKKHILHLEKIILSLEDQSRKANFQRKKDQEIIAELQHRIEEYETYNIDTKHESPSGNLDSLIKILEDELSESIDPEFVCKQSAYVPARKRTGGKKRNGSASPNSSNVYISEPEALPAKIVLGNFVKKTYLPTGEEQCKHDSLGRKKAITDIDMKKYIAPKPKINVYNAPNNFVNFQQPPKSSNLSKNIYPASDNMRDDKKYKMFKLAGHRL